jgi:excisionase family DNA binding protein
MPGLSLREAAQQTGTSKSTILRAIQSGRLSAGRLDDGGYSIDPSELFRVYEPKPAAPVQEGGADDTEGHDAPAYDADLKVRNAELESQIKALRGVLEMERERLAMERERLAMERERVAEEKRRSDELRAERDRWASQAERLALAPPTPAPVNVIAPETRGWWPFKRRA